MLNCQHASSITVTLKQLKNTKKIKKPGWIKQKVHQPIIQFPTWASQIAL